LQNEIDEIELVLKPHPLKEINLNSKRFLKTTSNATGIDQDLASCLNEFVMNKSKFN
jgi:uncharacterized protein YihD (DUF1040 family)